MEIVFSGLIVQKSHDLKRDFERFGGLDPCYHTDVIVCYWPTIVPSQWSFRKVMFSQVSVCFSFWKQILQHRFRINCMMGQVKCDLSRPEPRPPPPPRNGTWYPWGWPQLPVSRTCDLPGCSPVDMEHGPLVPYCCWYLVASKAYSHRRQPVRILLVCFLVWRLGNFINGFS